jgi:hypothetical protein
VGAHQVADGRRIESIGTTRRVAPNIICDYFILRKQNKFISTRCFFQEY